MSSRYDDVVLNWDKLCDECLVPELVRPAGQNFHLFICSKHDPATCFTCLKLLEDDDGPNAKE
jgi:hypothetical protein